MMEGSKVTTKAIGQPNPRFPSVTPAQAGTGNDEWLVKAKFHKVQSRAWVVDYNANAAHQKRMLRGIATKVE